MLDRLDTDLEQATTKMDVVMEALQKLLKTKDGCQIWTIVILTFILILLSKSLCQFLWNSEEVGSSHVHAFFSFIFCVVALLIWT
jgi:hypothetical protein